MGVGSARKITIEFLGKDKSLGRTAGEVESRTSRLGTQLRKVGTLAAIGLGAGVAIAAKGLYEMGKGAAEDQVQAKLLARQLKNAAGATKEQVAQTENWISAQGKALGVTDDELRPALGKLVRATHDVGKAQKLASLAMDVSAGSGKSLDAVSAALAKGQNGQVAGLAKLGIATKDASGKTLTFDQITKNLGKTFAGAATTKANTLQGKMDRLKLIMSETGESIGYKLLPVVTKMATWFLTKALPAISSFSKEMREKLGPVIEWVRGLFSSNTNGMASDVSKNLNAIKSTFQSVVSIISTLWNAFGKTLTTFAVQHLRNLFQVISGALQVISGIFKVFSSLLKGDWSGVWAGIRQILSGAWTIIKALVRDGWLTIRTLFKVAGIALRATLAGIWNGLKSLAMSGVNGLVSAVKSLPGKIRALGGLMKAAGKHILSSLLDGLKGGGGFVSSIAGSVWKSVKGMLNAAINRINVALPNSIGRGPFKVSLPANPIPRLASGAIIKRRPGGILANIGEGKYDEGVFPLDRNGVPRGMSAGGDSAPIVVQLVLDGKVILESLVKQKRTLGRPLGLS